MCHILGSRLPKNCNILYFWIFLRTICALPSTNQAIQIANWSSNVGDHRERRTKFLTPFNPYLSLGLSLQNLRLFGYIFQKFPWPVVWTQNIQKQDWLVLLLNQQPTFPWPTPKVKCWSLSGYPLPHAELESQFRRATCVVLLGILWSLQLVTGAT